jgi:hypothetical protein
MQCIYVPTCRAPRRRKLPRQRRYFNARVTSDWIGAHAEPRTAPERAHAVGNFYIHHTWVIYSYAQAHSNTISHRDHVAHAIHIAVHVLKFPTTFAGETVCGALISRLKACTTLCVLCAGTVSERLLALPQHRQNVRRSYEQHSCIARMPLPCWVLLFFLVVCKSLTHQQRRSLRHTDRQTTAHHSGLI